MTVLGHNEVSLHRDTTPFPSTPSAIALWLSPEGRVLAVLPAEPPPRMPSPLLAEWLRARGAADTLVQGARRWPPEQADGNDEVLLRGSGTRLLLQPLEGGAWLGLFQSEHAERWLRHEVGNALTAALNWLRMGAVRPERLAEANRRAEEALRNARAWLLAESGALEEEKEGDMAAVTRQVATVLQAEAESNRVRLHLRAPSRLRVAAPIVHLRSIVWNLVRNALEASASGGQVFVRLERTEEHALLLVCDEGHGMDAKTLRRVLQESFSSKGADRGVGLHLVRRLVERLGGRLRIDSAPGEGACIQVRLPVAPERPARHPEVHGAAKPSATGPRSERGAPRVLLVEDDPELRSLMSSVLRGAGYQVVTAASAREAHRSGGPFALLVTDEHLPDSLGSLLWERLSAAGQVERGVLCTGDPAVVPEHEHLRLLVKPFTPETLLRTVTEVVPPPRPRDERSE